MSISLHSSYLLIQQILVTFVWQYLSGFPFQLFFECLHYKLCFFYIFLVNCVLFIIRLWRALSRFLVYPSWRIVAFLSLYSRAVSCISHYSTETTMMLMSRESSECANIYLFYIYKCSSSSPLYSSRRHIINIREYNDDVPS